MKRILVVDDEENICGVLKMLLEEDGYEVATAHNGSTAIALIESNADPDLIISDLKMPEKGGMDLLAFVKQGGRDIPLVMITAYGSIENAVEAMKRGATDFIAKPFNKDVIRHIVRNTLMREDLKTENRLLRESVPAQGVVCESQAMKDIMRTVEKVATVPSAVLLLGESGTGKEVIARTIHARAAERARTGFSVPFVNINCPAVPETLIESELFGYRKGAFTGAVQNFSGRISRADNGVLFLDEIAEIPLKTQAKLLRFLEDKTFEPLGSTARIKVDTRIICATNKDLGAMVREGLFREDLYYRINTITIRIPPLRERREDILPLAGHFLAQVSVTIGKPMKGISAEARDALCGYAWPGNARELRNIMERAVVLSATDMVLPDCLPPEIKQSPSGAAAGDNKLEHVERDLLFEALRRHKGNISAAARELGITRDTIRYRMRKHGMAAG